MNIKRTMSLKLDGDFNCEIPLCIELLPRENGTLTKNSSTFMTWMTSTTSWLLLTNSTKKISIFTRSLLLPWKGSVWHEN